MNPIAKSSRWVGSVDGCSLILLGGGETDTVGIKSFWNVEVSTG